MGREERQFVLDGETFRTTTLGGRRAIKLTRRLVALAGELRLPTAPSHHDKLDEVFSVGTVVARALGSVGDRELDWFVETLTADTFLVDGDRRRHLTPELVDEHFAGRPRALLTLLGRLCVENVGDFFPGGPAGVLGGLSKARERAAALFGGILTTSTTSTGSSGDPSLTDTP